MVTAQLLSWNVNRLPSVGNFPRTDDYAPDNWQSLDGIRTIAPRLN